MQRFKKKPDLLIEEIEEEIVIYDPDARKIHHLNPMATVIWELCDCYRSSQDITKEIVGILKTNSSKVEKDVQNTLTQLQKKGLLE